MTEPPLIFVIDDDRDIREALVAVLSDEGLECQVAQNGAEALARLRSMPRLPQVIVLDLMMPVMSGWEFRAAQLADPKLAPIPTLILTAAVDAARHAKELSIACSLRKPIDLDELIRAIETLVPDWQS